MDDINYDDLDPGIRETVRWLRSLGFNTCDSGDGVSKGEDGMPFPHVFAVVNVKHLAEKADLLYKAAQDAGIDIGANEHETEDCVDHPYVVAQYDPGSAVATIGLINVDDKMLLAGRSQ